MNLRKICSLILSALFAATLLVSAAQRPSRPIGFANDIQAFLDQDKVSPPPQQAILFIGSSIFRQWSDLKTQMAPLPVFNRAFGGSRTWEVLHYVDKIDDLLHFYPPAYVEFTKIIRPVIEKAWVAVK